MPPEETKSQKTAEKAQRIPHLNGNNRLGVNVNRFRAERKLIGSLWRLTILYEESGGGGVVAVVPHMCGG